MLVTIKETGAIDYNHKLAVEHSEKAQEIARTELSKFNPDASEFLAHLAKYVVERGR